jgi:hypothetical protein
MRRATSSTVLRKVLALLFGKRRTFRSVSDRLQRRRRPGSGGCEAPSGVRSPLQVLVFPVPVLALAPLRLRRHHALLRSTTFPRPLAGVLCRGQTRGPWKINSECRQRENSVLPLGPLLEESRLPLPSPQENSRPAVVRPTLLSEVRSGAQPVRQGEPQV